MLTKTISKYKYFLLLAVVAILFLGVGATVQAQTVKTFEAGKYPDVPGLTTPDINCTTDCLPILVAYWFGVLIYVAGILAIISFVVGAVGLINPNVEAHSDAKDRMKSAVLGLVLTFASFVIIQTINPSLATLSTLTALPETTITTPVQPGVYFYSDPDCASGSTGPYFNSQGEMAKNIKAFQIINNVENNVIYGVIFHKERGLETGGDCTRPITSAGACQTISIVGASSVDIFRLNKTAGSSGNGIAFFSEPLGWNVGARAGYKEILDNAKYYNSPSYEEADKIKFVYFGTKVTDEYKKRCETFATCPGSIRIKGSYLVGVYSKVGCEKNSDCGQGYVCNQGEKICVGAGGDELYCQTFTKDVPNLNAQPLVASGSKILERVYIIPTK